MGYEGLKKVREKYTVEVCAPKLLSILNRVMKNNFKEGID